MSFYKIKTSTADVEFSLIIRELHGWRCERCGKLCRVAGAGVCRLEASHYIGRAKRSTRFDLDNVRSLCGACHRRMGGYKREEDGEYDLWMKGLLGQRGHRNLVLRANLPSQHPRDPIMEKLYVRGIRDQLIGEGKLTR